MKAKYLTIAGEKINVGNTYYAVSATGSFQLLKRKALAENNTFLMCCFKNENEAKHYKRLCELNKLISEQIKAIEKIHHNR